MYNKRLIAAALAAVGLVVSACALPARNGSVTQLGGDAVLLPPVDSDLIMYAVMPKDAIGEELPYQGLGTIHSNYWKATLGGYTQKSYSQALGFPPGTKITIHNLSKTTPHTLNVVKVIKGPPAVFPQNPNLSVPPRGKGTLQGGYARGPIKPGKTVTVTLAKAGIYLIGCAYHYKSGMRDVLVVGKNATPGPQATPPPKPTPTPTPRSRSSYAPDGV